MFEGYFSKQLRDDETMVAIVRRSPSSFFLPGLWALVTLLAPFFFLFPLLRWGSLGLLAAFVVFCVGLFLAVRVAVMASMNALCVTSERVLDVDQRGLFHRVVTELSHDAVQDVSISMKGVGQTVFRVGSVRLHAAGGKHDILAINVKHPEKVKALILSAKAAAGGDGEDGELSAAELLRVAERLKKVDATRRDMVQ